VYVGDDTGLLKKVKLVFSIQENIVSAPSRYRSNRLKRLQQEAQALGPEEEEKYNLIIEEEKPLIREKADISFKLLGKSGQ
jgi:hypothetical protein